MYLRSIAFPPASELVDFKRVVAAYNVLTLDNLKKLLFLFYILTILQERGRSKIRDYHITAICSVVKESIEVYQ